MIFPTGNVENAMDQNLRLMAALMIVMALVAALTLFGTLKKPNARLGAIITAFTTVMYFIVCWLFK